MRPLVLAVLASTVLLPVARADDAVDAAVKWVTGVGGTVKRDESAPGRPVVSVDFGPRCNKKFTDDDLKTLAAFKHLTAVNIVFCEQVTDAGAAHLKGFVGLQRLSLVNTSVGDAGIAGLVGLKKLKGLSLAGSIKLTAAVAESLAKLADLEELSLPSTFTDRGVAGLKGLTKLTDLYLGGADLSDAAVKAVAENHPDLKSLNVGTYGFGGSRITDDSVPHLAKLKRLKTLDLNGAKLTETGLAALRTALPDCQIGFKPPDKK